MALPVNVRDIVRSSTKIREEREKPLRIAIVIEADAPDELIDAVRDRFRPQTAGAKLGIEVTEPGVSIGFHASTDAVVGLVGSGAGGLSEVLADAREQGLHTVAIGVAETHLEVAERVGHPYADTVAALDAELAVDRELASWLVERLSGKRLALAHNFAFMRSAVAEEAVKATATQNALVGAVLFIPGADMPVMTLNQAKMLLQIAAAYGQPLGSERAKELLAVVGGGFALRTVARQALGVVPGFGWAVKGAIGYGGTIAMGKAAIAYFEQGADLSSVAQKAVEARDAAVKRLKDARAS